MRRFRFRINRDLIKWLIKSIGKSSEMKSKKLKNLRLTSLMSVGRLKKVAKVKKILSLSKKGR